MVKPCPGTSWLTLFKHTSASHSGTTFQHRSREYPKRWQSCSKILDSMMTWLAGVELNSIFLFSPSQAMSESRIFEQEYHILRYHFSTTYRDTRWETLNYYCKSRNTSTTNLRLTIPITLNNFSTYHRYGPYCKGKVQIDRLCKKKLLLGQPSHEYQD